MRHSTYRLRKSVDIEQIPLMQTCFVLRYSSDIQAFSAALLPLITDSDRPRIAGSSPLTASCDPARKTQEPTCLIIQEKSPLGNKLCDLISSQSGIIKSEVVI